ncbi:amphi-Trp domain-containing protein [Nocardia sp. NPDC058705]|uniref:amphi-Trp domain-containing protein n=1 Tax=Nocardia sp. NPDC058705 TaxID=3346609 RepID=UPI0036837F2E
MPKIEIKRKSELSRREVAERLIAIGQALADGSEVELGTGGDSIEIAVADQLQWEIEIEIDGDKTEIEIEISWRDEPAEAPAKPVRRARPRKAAPKK